MTNERGNASDARYGLSSVALADLRRKWADAGRDAWNAATRAGENIKAHTLQDLEALGRARLDEAARQRELAAAAGRVISGVGKTVASVARVGTAEDPGPGRLLAEWATGLGPQMRVLRPESSFSREFTQSPSVQSHLRERTADWRRENGVQGVYAVPVDKRATFDLAEVISDGLAGNGPAHFVGSWDAQGVRRGDGIDWRAENNTDVDSFFAGRLLKKYGLPHVHSYSRPWPGGRTHQSILFRTDLEGRPLGPKP